MLKVDGALYNKIVADKNLTADILPPPAFILESSWLTNLVREADTKEEIDAVVTHFERLESEYNASIENWSDSIKDEELREQLLVRSQRSARDFFRIFESELIPAMKNNETEVVDRLVTTDLKRHFEEHFDAIKNVVERNKAIEAEDQALATATVVSRTRVLGAIALSLLVCIGGFTAWLRRGVVKQELTNLDRKGQIEAIGRSQAVIEFDPEGNILLANDNFLNTVGYTLDEIKGRHHSMFVDESYRTSAAYRDFWANLGKGIYNAGEFKRIGKAGNEIWIQANYNPIIGPDGKPIKIVKFASDITEAKIKSFDAAGQLAAINRSQAVIEFDLTGKILHANDNFLSTLGYTLDEIKGRHHSMFVEESYRVSAEYREFWPNLANGKVDSGEFKRIGKGNSVVWIQASYNPILGPDGKPFKVVKYASNVTAQKSAEVELRNKVGSILEVVEAASSGDLTREITVMGEDAIGQMGSGLEKFLSDLRLSIASIAQNATALAGASEELSAVSNQMSGNAEETSSQANVVSAASEQVSQNVRVVATGVDEMNAAIREIAKNASDAARVSQQAVSVAETTNATIAKLGDSSAEIGKVVKVITSIAEQTNLLALNATIEAARAGEAGKGFAVVANEVKELAKETAKATEDISMKIDTIQADTRGAVEAIRQISDVINQINDISSTIASAVEEQTATANEMGRNVAEASRGASEIAENITAVATAADSTTQGASNTQQAANELSRMAAELQELISRFRYQEEELGSRAKGKRSVSPVVSFGSNFVGGYQNV